MSWPEIAFPIAEALLVQHYRLSFDLCHRPSLGHLWTDSAHLFNKSFCFLVIGWSFAKIVDIKEHKRWEHGSASIYTWKDGYQWK